MSAFTVLAALPAGAETFATALASPSLYLSCAIASSLAGILYLGFHLVNRKRRVLIQSETTRIRLIARRNLCTAIVIAPSVEESPLSRSLEPWLAGLGFSVTRIEDLELLAQGVDFTPTITVVDCEMNSRMVSRIDAHFQTMSLSPSATVIFYNATPGIRTESRKFLKNVHFLGDTFTRTEIVRIIAPLIMVETVSDGPAKMTLEGELGDQATGEVLEYLETAGKTGVLIVRDPDCRVLGVVGVENGSITHARTDEKTGESAAMDILAVSRGFFQFHAGQPQLTPNCRILPTHLLLQRAQTMDEERRGIAAPRASLALGG